ncbi:MAG: hypothetical protein SGJ01_03515 [Gemmatimonadota bacterium]|nr:hypothetical protein [Gemmatimonadota bacterium]
MISSSDRPAPRGLAVASLLIAALVAGCAESDPPAGPRPLPTGALAVGLAASSLAAGLGDTLSLRIVADPGEGERLAAVQGTLRFDAHRLRYFGQPLAGTAFVLVNPAAAEQGTLRVASLRLAGLSRETADLRFVVLSPAWETNLRYDLDEAVTPDVRALHGARRLPLVESPFPNAAGAVSLLTLKDWWRYFGLTERAYRNVPGAGTVFGDITLNGFIDVLDASGAANLAVGNRQLITEANRDYVIAGDVAPANLPGLGEATDLIPPGRNPDGSYSISVLDAVSINNQAVGNAQPVAGQPIPGRQPRPFRVTLSGTINASRTLSRDTIYELQGNVLVGQAATLIIQPGTVLEGQSASRGALVVVRAGNIDWRGTRLEPIIFTCTGTVKTPGCWGGVALNGLALLNNRDPGTTGFCPEKFAIGSSEVYGGCLVEDTTGVMSYVRIEYAGMAAGASGPVAGLALNGVGSGTVVDHVQVHGSLGDGVLVAGGNVNLRNIVLTGNLQSGLHWDFGWGGNAFGGNAQFVMIQMPQGGGDAVRGSSFAATPNAGPRSEPDIYHLTAIGAGTGGGSGRGLVLENGSGGIVRDAIFSNFPGAGFDVQGTESCNQFSGGTAFLDHSIFFAGTPDYATDADCIDESAYAGAPALFNRITDPGLVAAMNTLTPDLRPTAGSAATTGFVTPPSNLFFDLTPTFLGITEPVNGTGTNIPWYAGWTRGWIGVTP